MLIYRFHNSKESMKLVAATQSDLKTKTKVEKF